MLQVRLADTDGPESSFGDPAAKRGWPALVELTYAVHDAEALSVLDGSDPNRCD